MSALHVLHFRDDDLSQYKKHLPVGQHINREECYVWNGGSSSD
jgi:hypothetical protein